MTIDSHSPTDNLPQEANAAAERLAPTIVREVLERLAARKLAGTPENFTWMYRQVMHARNLPIEVQYTHELDALRHALTAFQDLLVGNAWLSGRFSTLEAVIDDKGRAQQDRVGHAKIILNEIGENKKAALLQMARLVAETRESINEMLLQVSELTDRISSGRENFERAQTLIEHCTDLDDFKVALRAIATDVRQLNRTTKRASQSVTESYGQFATGAPYLFGPPRAGHANHAAGQAS